MILRYDLYYFYYKKIDANFAVLKFTIQKHEKNIDN